MGLVTAEEFRKAREAADSMEADEAKRRQEKEVRLNMQHLPFNKSFSLSLIHI